MKKTAILLAATLMTSAAAHAGGITGNELLANCQSDDGLDKMSCYRYVNGVGDGINVADELSIRARGVAITRICIPNEVTAGQVAAVAVRFMNAHPQDLHLQAAALLLRAYSETWPCT